MNPLIGKVQVLPVNNYTIWYRPQGFEGVQTDAHLIAQESELILITSGWETRIIHLSEVTRIVTPKVAIGEEINAQEIQEYEQYWADR